jgi:type VI protein secretion system component Hcp
MRYGRDEGVRLRRPNELRRRAGDAAPGPRQPVAQLLALQRSAGNRAVSALLARSPDTAVPADAKGTKASRPRATLTGIGTIPLLSVSLDPGRGAGRPGGRGGSGRETFQEIVVSSRLGPHSTQLSKAVLDGTAMDVEIVMPRGKSAVRLRLKGAIVSSYSTSSGDDSAIESWTLNFSAMEHSVEGEPGESDGQSRKGAWDDAAGPDRRA